MKGLNCLMQNVCNECWLKYSFFSTSPWILKRFFQHNLANSELVTFCPQLAPTQASPSQLTATPSTQTQSLGIHLYSALCVCPRSRCKQGLWALPPHAIESCSSPPPLPLCHLPCPRPLGEPPSPPPQRASQPPRLPLCSYLPPCNPPLSSCQGDISKTYIESCHSLLLNIYRLSSAFK